MPAEIRRRVLVEAGHRCAIPACRYIETEVHHIIPWSECQTHDYDNLIALCPNCHRRADRGEIDRKSLRLYKANLRFIHDKYSQLEMDVLFGLKAAKENMAVQWPPFMLILLKRVIESGYVAVHTDTAVVAMMGGMRMNPDYIKLTPEGRTFLDDLGITEL